MNKVHVVLLYRVRRANAPYIGNGGMRCQFPFCSKLSLSPGIPPVSSNTVSSTVDLSLSTPLVAYAGSYTIQYRVTMERLHVNGRSVKEI